MGVSLPLGQRLFRTQGKTWLWLCMLLSVMFLSFSIISVNTSAAKTFDMRTLERKSDRLTEQVSVLESQAAILQSYASLQQQVTGMGYVPVQNVRYLDVK